ncbi:hypothetical protein SpCBS45565_g07145 [Spizellomyces sp. 'palustris']|nr:hypothetical protein SpCBS45565_g07145 [Spizellomyces sp. 'palustris']
MSSSRPPIVESCLADLTRLLGTEKYSSNERDLVYASKDVSYHTPSRPYAVCYAEREDDVAMVLKTCNKYGVPVIPIAGKTSLEGGTIPGPSGAVVLDVSRMDKIVSIHEDDLDCVVEPGVGWMELKHALEPLGLFFPPDPGAAACVGGMCGTNCSGTLAWRYGTMSANVLSLRVVLADGTVIRTRRRATKSSAGYDLTRMFVGSEGTLGVITQITLRLRRVPKVMAVAMSQFGELEAAAQAVQQIVQSGILLHRLELMDTFAIRSVNMGRPKDEQLREETTLLFEFATSSQATLKDQSGEVKSLCQNLGASSFKFAEDKAEADRLWNIRKQAYFAARHLRSDKDKEFRILTTDVAVPISRIREALHITRKDLAVANLHATILAHVGDGNFHVLLVIDPDDSEEVRAAEAFRERNARMAIDMDGTCTGEHGIGTGKIGLLPLEVGAQAVEVMRKMKKSLDPNGILNPGKVFSVEPSETLLSRL